MGYHFTLNKSVRPQKTEDTEFSVQFSSVQSLSCVWLLATPWIAACQASLSITNSRSLPKLIEYYWGKKYLGILIHCWQTLSGCNLAVSKMEEPGRLQSMGSLRVRQTERFHFHFSLWCIGEGNGNPLQCSCLENPRDGGAWWAAVYGVAESDTTDAT